MLREIVLFFIYMKDIIGHSKILSFFDKVIKNENLSHAYCFVGSESVGKRAVAEYIAGRLLGVEKSELNKNADFISIEQIINEKTGKLRKDISIEQIRELITRLYSRAFVKDGYKIAIIDQAELMSRGASNALLKTLEEPKEKTILFLTTIDESKLLPTIQSRCQMIYFSPVPTELIKIFLESKDIDSALARDLALQAHGMPGMAISWYTDKELYETYKKEIERFRSLQGKNFYEKLQAVEELFGDKTDHIMARENLQKILDIWQLQLHEQIVDGKLKNSLVAINEDIKKAKDLLSQNVHPRLLVEHILLQIP